MKTIDQHAADFARVIDAIKSIPPSPPRVPKVREWIDNHGNHWRLIDGRIEYRERSRSDWRRSFYDSIEGMILDGKKFGIREITTKG